MDRALYNLSTPPLQLYSRFITLLHCKRSAPAAARTSTVQGCMLYTQQYSIIFIIRFMLQISLVVGTAFTSVIKYETLTVYKQHRVHHVYVHDDTELQNNYWYRVVALGNLRSTEAPAARRGLPSGLPVCLFDGRRV